MSWVGNTGWRRRHNEVLYASGALDLQPTDVTAYQLLQAVLRSPHWLELADPAKMSDVIEIDVLIGSDVYFVSGEVIREDCGPTAIHTKVGWILLEPMKPLGVSVNLTLMSAHTYSEEPTLEGSLKQFWDWDSLGIMKEEDSLYDKFVQEITFDGHQYEDCLPWKEHHPPLINHRELRYKWLLGLLRRLN